jgi:hypothetical protein
MEMDSALIGAGGSTISASGIGGAIGPIQRGGSSVLTTADAGQDGTVTAVATGGSLGRGGSSESGSPDGVSAAGGAIGAGGAIAVGGFVAAGGVPGIGGSRSVGGALNAGGAVAAGGASVGGSNAGGASGAGGNSLSIVTCCIALQSTCTCVQVPQVTCDAYVSAGYTRVSSCSGGAGGSSGTGGSYGAGGSPGGLSCSTSNTYPLTMNCARSRVGSAGMVVCSSGKLDCYPVGTSAPTIVSCSFNDFTSFGYPFTCADGTACPYSWCADCPYRWLRCGTSTICDTYISTGPVVCP